MSMCFGVNCLPKYGIQAYILSVVPTRQMEFPTSENKISYFTPDLKLMLSPMRMNKKEVLLILIMVIVSYLLWQIDLFPKQLTEASSLQIPS